MTSLLSFEGAGATGGPTVAVRVSARSLRLRFNGCDPEYIRDVCHGACCRSTVHPDGMLVVIHPREAAALRRRGAQVVDGHLRPRPGERGCPFQGPVDHLCALHDTPDKPFGCRASPFTLTVRHTLIVRNRYKLLKCFRDGRQLPAYVAFRASLDLLFGRAEAARVCDHLSRGGGDITAHMPARHARMLRDIDLTRDRGR